jgi:hypothetical protein
MDISSTLILLAVTVLAAAFVAGPLITAPADGAAKQTGRRYTLAMRQRADLLATRNQVYHALSELDFDYKTGKIAEAEYQSQRRGLVAEGIRLLKALDALPAEADDPIEAALGGKKSAGKSRRRS